MAKTPNFSETSASTPAQAPPPGAAAVAALAGHMPPVRPGYYSGEHYRIDESIGYLMKNVVERLSRAVDARMADYSLTDAQWRPLLLLSQHQSGTASQVARSVGCDTGAMTRMLDRLEDKGLLRRVRSADDRRVQQIELSEEGRQAAAVVPYVIADVLNTHLADLSHAEIDQLRSLLKRVIATGQRIAATDDGLEPKDPS